MGAKGARTVWRRPARSVSAARDERLRIAVVAPPWFEVPLNGYGGIERVCAALVDGLVERGRDVTLIAGRPPTQARFIPALPEPPPGLGTVEHPVQEVRWAAAVAPVLEELEMDFVHDHSLAGPLLGLGRARPTVVTAHGPVDGWVGDYYRRLGLHRVALSQRAAAEDLPRVGVVASAVDVRRLPFRSSKEEFALFMGRFSPEKGAHVAVDAAAVAGVPIALAGKCGEPAEARYFDKHVAPRLGGLPDPGRRAEPLQPAVGVPVRVGEPRRCARPRPGRGFRHHLLSVPARRGRIRRRLLRRRLAVAPSTAVAGAPRHAVPLSGDPRAHPGAQGRVAVGLFDFLRRRPRTVRAPDSRDDDLARFFTDAEEAGGASRSS